MATETFEQHQCQCSAYFASPDLLLDHIEQYLAGELEKCQKHVRVEPERPEEAGMGRYDLVCPHEPCDRVERFSTGQRLRRHFQQHVTCQEICVFCFKRFYLASEFIRHTPKHPDDESVKSIFMRDTSQMLRDRVAGELEAKQKSSKRAWRDATLDQNMARAKKARQNAVDFRSIDSQIHLGDQRSMEHANPYHLESATMFQFAAPLELEHQQAQLLDTNFTDPHATVLYPTDLEQAAQMSADLDNFDAPVYAILSGPPIWSSQTGWIQEVPGGDTLNNGQLYHQVS